MFVRDEVSCYVADAAWLFSVGAKTCPAEAARKRLDKVWVNTGMNGCLPWCVCPRLRCFHAAHAFLSLATAFRRCLAQSATKTASAIGGCSRRLRRRVDASKRT
eukprot:358605-Chlamydomonas_euryale.AAC.7